MASAGRSIVVATTWLACNMACSRSRPIEIEQVHDEHAENEPLPEVAYQRHDGPDAWARLPYQLWPAVPGRVVGLLYQSGHHSWGATVDHMKHVGGNGNYVFSFDRSSPYALYFPSDGRGHNALKKWAVPTADGGEARYDAAMYGPKTPNDWGLSRPAHVVELEVNGGRGGSGIHFVATNVRVLDGTDQVPLEALTVLADMRRRFDELLSERQGKIDAIFEETRAAANAAAGPHGWWSRFEDVEEPVVVVLPTWEWERRMLRTVLAYLHRGKITGQLPPPPVECPPGAPCAQDPGETREYGFGVTFGLELAVDPTGKLVEEIEHPPAPRTEW